MMRSYTLEVFSHLRQFCGSGETNNGDTVHDSREAA